MEGFIEGCVIEPVFWLMRFGCIKTQRQKTGLNKAKRLLFESTVTFKNSHVFICQTASQPAISRGCARCRASKITLSNGLLRPIYKTAILKTIILLRHGDSFVLPSNALFSIQRYVCVNKLCHGNIRCKGITTVLICACCFVRAISLA